MSRDNIVIDVQGRTTQGLGILQSDLTILDSKFSKSGALSQKWRIRTRREPLMEVPGLLQDLSAALGDNYSADISSDDGTPTSLPYTPSPPPQHYLAQALVATFEVPHSGYKLTAFGSYMRQIPRYLGESTALDAAVACLTDAHDCMMRRDAGCENQVSNPVLYLKALQRLQAALKDPLTGTSACTLAATTLLGIVETLGGLKKDSKYLSHAGGTMKIIEIRGPSSHIDGFDGQILRSQRGKIIIQSLWSGTSCFLESKDWRNVAFHENADLTETDLYHDKVLKHLILIPRLLRDYRSLSHAESAALSLDILYRLRSLRSSLRDLGLGLESRLHDPQVCTEVPSDVHDSLVPVCYSFADWPEVQIYSHFWALTIVANTMLMDLTGSMEQEALCCETAQKICKLYECSRRARPFGSHFMVLSLATAFRWVPTEEMKDWIVEALNELADAKATGMWWCTLAVEYFADMLMGKNEPMLVHTTG
ncbi:MAG: hypothetical protein M1820_000822 [Bogoriella megaspora]|nr:MAG: hypothetical protein M1820_000822 [Bogoriella megaspora]